MRDIVTMRIVLLIAVWLFGFIGSRQAVGNMIHLLLVVVVILVIYRLVTGRQAP